MTAAHRFLCDRFYELGYIQELRALESLLQTELWLVGGWVRSTLLDEPNYQGDIDCLCTITVEQLRSVCRHLHRATANFIGGVRVRLADGNHVDISSTHTLCNTVDVVDALSLFNMSVNAAAIRLSDGAIVAAPHALEDLAQRKFRVFQPHNASDCPADVLADIDAMINFYALAPNDDMQTSALVEEVSRRRQRLASTSGFALVREAKYLVQPLIPKHCQAWLVRGYLRCCYLGGLCYWDDADVVVGCTLAQLFDHLNESGAPYIINFHGHPKVRDHYGNTVDLWPLNSKSILEDISGYEFNVDRAASDIETDTIVDPTGALTQPTRQLAVGCDSSQSDDTVSYLALKATYLCLRHDLSVVDAKTIQLLARPITPTGFIGKNTHRLARELWSAHPGCMPERFQRLADLLPACPALLSLQAAGPRVKY